MWVVVVVVVGTGGDGMGWGLGIAVYFEIVWFACTLLLSHFLNGILKLSSSSFCCS